MSMICPKCGKTRLAVLPDGRLRCRNNLCNHVFDRAPIPPKKDKASI